MKKLINAVDNVVDEMLDGMVCAYPDKLRRLDGLEVLVRAQGPADKVALVSGGGSGHEPSHGGYVGTGMLDAAVAGAVFTSPTPDQVYEAIMTTNSGKGVLLIIKNYTGDVMNFEMAADMARDEGVEVEQVVTADDVAVENSTYTIGRRGIAGTILVHKIAGACAETGADLATVKRVAEKVIANERTMGMALSACTVPAAGKPSFELADDEVEIGLGIHGEPGVSREKLAPANDVVDQLLEKILAEDIYHAGDEVVVMVNGLGATPLMELFVANKHLAAELAGRGIKVYKTMVGNFMTSLDMAGFSITLLKVDDELKAFVDAPCNTPALVQA
ncbi:MAG: dihydroxyacetone kinase subunit DhaK [Coriobacteriales bacterium]|nr:dihydroxyacetone kinase subunit DhaK [Coriobacteriales bacterium]